MVSASIGVHEIVKTRLLALDDLLPLSAASDEVATRCCSQINVYLT